MTDQPPGSKQLTAIILMVMGAALITSNDALSKYLADYYPVGQIVTLRHTCSILILLAYVAWRNEWMALAITNWAGQFYRGVLFTAIAFLMVLGVKLLPLPTVTAIAFASPLLVAALSWSMLGERVGPRRWAAVMVGFIGVLLIIRPGGVDFTWLLMIPVAAAVANALRDIVTRQLSRTESSLSILFWSTIVVTILSLASAPFGWQSVDAAGVGWFFLLGALNSGAHFLMIEALRLGDAALISPFRYSALLWSILFGFMFWQHIPDVWTLAGGLLVVAAGIYIIERKVPANRA